MSRRRLESCRRKRFKRMILAGRPWVECHYCGKRLNAEELTLDHVIPLSRRGDKGIRNIIPACVCCNGARGNIEYGKFVARYVA